MSSRHVRSRSTVAIALLSLTALLSCGGESTPTETENPTISISINPAAASVEQGSSTDVAVTVTGAGGFSGSATVTVDGVPTGVTGTVGNVQSSGGNTTATATIAVGAGVAAGNYTLTVRATGSGVSAVTASFTLTVTAAPAYGLSASPSQLIIEQDAQGTTNIALARTNFTGNVTLSVEGAPSGMTTSFDLNPVSGNAAVLTLAPDGTVAIATYTLTIRGTATGLADRTVTVDVMVTAPAAPDYLIGVNPAALTINQGDNEDAAITLTRSNFTDAVTLSAEGVPANVTVSFSENPVNDNDSEMTVAVGAGVPTGAYSFTLRSTATGLPDKTVTIDLTVEDASSYTLGLAPSTISVDQGASETVDVTITRLNFAEAVTLSVEGAPAEVTSQFSVNPVPGTASVLTIDVGAAVAPGVYGLTVRGTSASLSVTESLTLTVTEAVGFSLDAIAGLTVQQGASGVRAATITRTGGFAGDVTVTVTDLTAGITATVNPVTTAGNSVDVTINVAGSVAVGNYTATVRGNATGQPESTQTLDISVTTAAGQQVSLDFSVCVADERPVWLAYQDGSGPWTPVSGVGDTYTFNVAAATAAIAISTQPTISTSSVFVYYATQAEMVAANLEDLCEEVQTGKTVNASVANIGLGEGATISLGEAFVDILSVNGSIAINDVPDGNLDLVGYKWSQTGASDRMFLRRDVNAAADSDIGLIDFDDIAGDAFFPQFATMTVTGGSGSGLSWASEYATSPSPGTCYYASLNDDFFAGAGTQFLVGGAPTAEQETGPNGDFHYVAITDLGSLAFVSEMFQTMAPRTIPFGAALPAPTITDITGTAAYRRARVELTLPAEYDETAIFALTSGTASITAIATAAWLGGQTVSLEIPDFTGLAGWDDSWAPTNASTTDWWFSASGWTGTDCVEDAREVSRTVLGTVG